MTDLAPPTATPEPVRLSPVARAVRIFARPADAWEDLRQRGQWWFPLLLTLVISLGFQALSFDRVIVPMMEDQWAELVASGQMPPAQQAELERTFIASPVGRVGFLVQAAVLGPVFMLFFALVVWFGVGFVLGTRLKFRHAFEVICWSGLVKIPQAVLLLVLALQRETLEGIHMGLGVIPTEPETPSKLFRGMTSFLDLIGPFEAWWIAVGVLGCAALSGAPRRNVAWVLVVLYLALGACYAAVSAFFGPGS